MLKTKMIPLDSVLKDVYMLLKESDVNEDLVMEFAIRAMEHLSTYKTYEHKVCILKVDNFQAPFPAGMLGIEAVLYRANIQNYEEYIYVTQDLRVDVNEETHETEDKKYTFKILDFKQLGFLKQKGWQYLGLSNSPFDRSILCNTDAMLHSTCSEFYYPDTTNDRFITSFQEGYIAVAYYAYPMNEEGQFLIPDNPLVLEAVLSYVLSKTYQRLWNMSVQGAEGKHKYYLQQWQELCAAAVGQMMMLSLPDYINVDKNNRFFKNGSPLRIFGGYGKERVNFGSPNIWRR